MFYPFIVLIILGDAASPVLFLIPALMLLVIVAVATFIILWLVKFIKNRKNK